MPLQPVATTEVAAANQIAQRIVQEINQTASRIAALRANGIPAVAAVPAGVNPNGQPIPARPATAAVSAAAIDAALGTENRQLLDAIKDLLIG
jgi:hypothetical protein